MLAGFKAACHGSNFARLAVQVFAAILMAGYMAFFWNRPILAHWLPVSGLIIVGNLLPVCGSFFLGMYMKSNSVGFARRVTVSFLTSILVVYSGCAPLVGKVPDGVSVTSVGPILHQQSTPFTCSAACAVSLLRLHGLEASEAELADLCLTREGTHWMGLYRGMMLKTAGTGWTVAVEEIDQDSVFLVNSPCILALNIDTSVFPPELDHGFDSQVGHSVVYLGRSSPSILNVFDPSPDYGLEDWGPEILSCVKGGVAIKLVRRDQTNVPSVDVARNTAEVLLKRRLTAGI